MIIIVLQILPERRSSYILIIKLIYEGLSLVFADESHAELAEGICLGLAFIDHHLKNNSKALEDLISDM